MKLSMVTIIGGVLVAFGCRALAFEVFIASEKWGGAPEAGSVS
jgi:hypothetical protein